MSEERFSNTVESISTAKFAVHEAAMTMRQTGRIFHLDPAPPKVADINDYIVSAIREQDNTYFTYFLHLYESRLNRRVYRFLLNEDIDRYDPLRFLDYKLSCVLAMLECLQNYTPDKGANFLTYAHHFIGNALLDCRRQEEAGSFVLFCQGPWMPWQLFSMGIIGFLADVLLYKAVHRYANDDDEWGEIRFDFSVGTAKIIKLADGDTNRTNVSAKIAIRQILKLSMSELPKKLTIPFELEMEKIRYGS